MLSLLELITFVWLFGWALLAVKQLAEGHRHSILFVMLVFFVFCGIPLFFDILIGKPSYNVQPGFHLASRDLETSLIYCALVSAIPLVWYGIGRSRSEFRPRQDAAIGLPLTQTMTRLKPLFVLFLVAPAILVLLAPNRSDYMEYAFQIKHRISINRFDYHAIVSSSTLLSVIGVGGLLITSRRLHASSLAMTLPFLVLACYLNGKRHIVAFALCVIVFVLWQKQFLIGIKLLIVGALAIFATLAFSVFYQAYFRGETLTDLNQVYDNVRVDFGRDGGVKLAIYAELNPGRVRILEHRGQSLLFYIACYVPRSVFPDKPWPYAVYMTSAMFMHDVARPLGWGVTTSVLDEAIANFGWIGLVLGPLLVALLCKLGDSRGNSLTQILTIVVGLLLMVIQLVAFLPLFILWLISVAFSLRSKTHALTGIQFSRGMI